MNTVKLYWNLLRYIGCLPDELIIKILYEFYGLKHPIVTMLHNSTKVKEYEDLQKLSISKIIYNFYLNQEKYQKQYNYSIIDFIDNQQRSYCGFNTSYNICDNNPGYFFPRQFGRLYYNTLNDNDLVETKIHVDWKLNRSKNIYLKIRRTKALIGGMVRFHLSLTICLGDREKFENESYVYKLMTLEKYFEKEYPNTYLKQYY